MLTENIDFIRVSNQNGWEARGASFIPIPALALPLNTAVFITAHSSVPFTPVISAHTCTDPAVSFTLSMSVTIWIAALFPANNVEECDWLLASIN